MLEQTRQSRLSSSQFSALKRGLEVGSILAKEHSDIGERWIRGEYYREIAEKLEICTTYGLSQETSKSAVKAAVHGHDGQFGVPAFDGTLPPGIDSSVISAAHKREGAKRGGQRGAQTQQEQCIGIYAASFDRSSAALKGAEALGYTGWLPSGTYHGTARPSERRYAYELSQIQKYRSGSRANVKAIAQRINEIYHDKYPVRNGNTIGMAIAHYEKENGLRSQASLRPAYTAWGEKEMNIASRLATRESWQRDTSMGRFPDWKKITDFLNEHFHNETEVRKWKGVRYKVKELLKTERRSESLDSDHTGGH